MNLKNYALPIYTAFGIASVATFFSVFIALGGMTLDGIQINYLMSIPLQFIGAMGMFRGSYRGILQNTIALGIVGIGSSIGFISLSLLNV